VSSDALYLIGDAQFFQLYLGNSDKQQIIEQIIHLYGFEHLMSVTLSSGLN